MRARAAVIDVHTPVLVLRLAYRRIRFRAVRRLELYERNVRDLGPELLRGIEIEALVQIDTSPHACFVDRKKCRSQRQKNTTMSALVFANSTLPSVFEPSPA